MGGCCKGKKKEQNRYDQQESQYEVVSAECMPKIPPDELCTEEQRQEFSLHCACGTYLTRRVFIKSPDDALFDALYAVDDLMDFWEECPDDPQYYNKGPFQDPCTEAVIREKMNKECRKRVACEPICLPRDRSSQ